jgi:hypothetical protein
MYFNLLTKEYREIMSKSKYTLFTVIIASLILGPLTVVEAKNRDNKNDRKVNSERNHRSDRTVKRHLTKGKQVIVIPGHRKYRNIKVVRSHGHFYPGYGHHHYDNDAWKWLAFTAITLKVLDNLDEQAQREHEAAQIRATSAAVGEKIMWNTADSSGYVVTSKEGQSESGLSCREFTQSVTIGGDTEQAYGTACLQADGSWEMIN